MADKTAIKRLPRGYPHRFRAIPGWATLFQVPRHVVRIDIDAPGRAGTHGWQVRYRKPWAFFGDNVGGKRRTPKQSLTAAIQHLAAVYAGPKSQIRATPSTRKKNPIQEAGIRLVLQKKPNRTATEVYVEATSPSRRTSSKRFYAGTSNTVTPARIEAALIAARAARKAIAAEHLALRNF